MKTNTIINSALAIKANCNMDKTKLLAIFTSHFKIYNAPAGYVTSYHYARIQGCELRNRIYDGCLSSVQDSKNYAVIYFQCKPKECFDAPSLELSYRSTILGNFVLVRPVSNQIQSNIATQYKE